MVSFPTEHYMKFNPQLDWSVKYSAFFHTQYLCMYVFQKILKLWNHYLPLSVQILQICGSPLKILGTRMGISRMSNTEDPSILGANLQNSAVRGPWRTWFLYPCTYLHNINRQVFVKKRGCVFLEGLSCIFGYQQLKHTSTKHLYKCDRENINDWPEFERQ